MAFQCVTGSIESVLYKPKETKKKKRLSSCRENNVEKTMLKKCKRKKIS